MHKHTHTLAHLMSVSFFIVIIPTHTKVIIKFWYLVMFILGALINLNPHHGSRPYQYSLRSISISEADLGEL